MNEEHIQHSAATLRQRLGARQPRIAILLGSGWGPVADAVQGAVDVPYAYLPAFPELAVGGHHGVLRAGTLGGREVMVLAGRKHAYETGTPDGMAGAVQHGASTLPDAAFGNFPRLETAEIHLATNFQTMMFDHIPSALRGEMYAWLDANAKDERKATDTDEQFYYKARKKAIGPFKKQLWALPAEVRGTLGAAYDKKFAFLFEQLGIVGTRAIVEQFVTMPEQHRPFPTGASTIVAAPDDADISD